MKLGPALGEDREARERWSDTAARICALTLSTTGGGSAEDDVRLRFAPVVIETPPPVSPSAGGECLRAQRERGGRLFKVVGYTAKAHRSRYEPGASFLLREACYGRRPAAFPQKQSI
jgi:hypothetical protein